MVAVARSIEPRLAKAIATTGPLRLTRKRQASPFVDVLCRAVAGQQLSVKAAQSIWDRVLEAARHEPLSDFLHRAEPSTLRECGLSGAKAKAMGEIAKAGRAGALNPGVLRRLDHAARSEHLTAIWGVGPWTADMMGIFYFSDPDIWPDGDVAARKTLERLTSRRRSTVRTAERFAPYRSYLALHMWRHVAGVPGIQT